MLVPFLTLCADICPFTTGILLQVEKALEADHATSKVEIVELSVDPHRDTTARLAAYAKLTHAGWQLVRMNPADLAKFQKFFEFTYVKVPEDNPPSIDWMTGKPLTYDIQHSDDYFVIDPEGHERIVEDAAPDYTGQAEPEAPEVPQRRRPRTPEAPATARLDHGRRAGGVGARVRTRAPRRRFRLAAARRERRGEARSLH